MGNMRKKKNIVLNAEKTKKEYFQNSPYFIYIKIAYIDYKCYNLSINWKSNRGDFMSEYYFFNEVKKVQEIEKWFRRNFRDIVYLEHTAPVTFSIDNVTYATRQDERGVIFTIKLYGKDKDMRTYHNNIRKRVEKYLNVLKGVNL